MARSTTDLTAPGRLNLRVVITVALSLASSYHPASGIVPIENFFPFGASAGDSIVPTGDDGFVGPINFTYPYPYYDTVYTSGFVNMNGAVSFLDGVATYTPTCDTNIASSVGMISPFWADVYTVNGGVISYRQTSDPVLLKKYSDEYNSVVFWMYTPPPKWLFIVTWFEVGFYNVGCSNDAGKNTFQLVMASDGVSSGYMVNYNNITWTTGTASGGNCSGLGGVPAKVGFELAGSFYGFGDESCTDAIVNIEDFQTQYVPQPNFGKFLWQTDNTFELATACSRDPNVPARQLPIFVDGYGHMPIAIHGPCFDDVISARCIFYDGRGVNGISVPGLIIPESIYFTYPNVVNITVCEVPYLYGLPYGGPYRVDLVTNSSTGQETTYFSSMYENAPDGLVTGSITYDATTSNALISLYWNTNGFQTQTVPGLNVILLQYSPDNNVWAETTTIATNIANNGAYSQQVALSTFGNTTASFYAIRLKPTDQVPFRKKRDLALIVGEAYKNTGYLRASQFTPPTCVFNPALDYNAICDAWFASDPGAPSDLLTCPPTLAQAQQDINFEAERVSQVAYLYPGASFVYRQRVPSPSHGGISCGYNTNGQMVLGTGRSARTSPAYDFFAHWRDDVVPWCNCCKFPTSNQFVSCSQYYQKRPFNAGSGYVPPAMASGNGDPHIRTLDGLRYTFNGVGEYYCIKPISAGGFQIQCRLEQWASMTSTVDGVAATANASVFTAVVFSDGVSKIQVAVSAIGQVDIVVDGELVPFRGDVGNGDTPRTISTSTSSVTKAGTDITVAFPGYMFTIVVNLNSLTFTSFVSAHNSGTVNGLLGHFDYNQTNDLTAANGNVIPATSNLQTIHNDFGLTWLVSGPDSIFTYARGQSYNTFYNPGFQPSFTQPNMDNLPPEVVATCQNSSDCLYDYATTGDLAFANNSGTQQRKFESTATVLSPANNPCVCPNPPTTISKGFVINNATNYYVGSKVYFGCYSPYKCICGTNKKSIQCVANPGNTCAWQSPVPRCQTPLPILGCLANLGCLLADILRIL